ncbi:MAG TPA: hypothetical protein ENI87_11380 [bacterium]|nr:hypothetical protein [bacterium]
MNRLPNRRRAAAATALLALFTAGCSHRAVAVCSGAIPIGEQVRRIRLVVENGTIDIAVPESAATSDVVAFQGGVRMDATSDEGLVALRQVPPGLTGAPDPADPTVLVVRTPARPAGVTGMIAFEGGIRVPAELPLDVEVRENGHVTMVGRRAASEVHTRRGDLRFEDCRGGVTATTGHGVLIAFGHHGDLDVQSKHGDMQAFFDEVGEKILLSTGKGTIQCHVPAGGGYEVSAHAEIGRIGTDFDLESRTVGDGGYGAAVNGRVGDGRTKVILRTASGHISLVPRKS